MRTTLWITAAGGLGAASRYHVEGFVSRMTGGEFPWGTLVVNVSGSFLLGFLFVAMTERFLPHPELRSALTIGFVGAYTTFSTLVFETFQLGRASAIGLAVLNIVLSITAGLLAVWAGTLVGRAL